MASQLLATDVPIAKSPSSDLCLRPLSPPTKLCTSLHPGNPFPCLLSSSPSLILQLRHPGCGGRDARVFCISRAVRVGFLGQETCALCLGCKRFNTSDGSMQAWSCHAVVPARVLHQRTERKRTAECMGIYGSTEIMSRHGSREVVVSHSGRICHGSRLHKGSSTYRRGWDGDDHGFLGRLHHKQSSLNPRVFLKKQCTLNVCRCLSAGFLNMGFFATENDEKQRHQDRQRALLSLLVQAMVASHMVQSPLLSLLWTKWPSMVDELCAGGERGGKIKGLKGQVDCTREHSNASSFLSSLLRVLLIGSVIGAVIVMTMNLPISAGALLDVCLWLCLLCSFLFLAAWTGRVLFCMAMFVSRGGIMALLKSCTSFLLHWVGSFCRGFFAGASTLFACIFWLKGGGKHTSRTSSSLLSSLWSSPSIKSEGKRVRSIKRGRLGHFSFLQNILSKQTKL